MINKTYYYTNYNIHTRRNNVIEAFWPPFFANFFFIIKNENFRSTFVSFCNDLQQCTLLYVKLCIIVETEFFFSNEKKYDILSSFINERWKLMDIIAYLI